MAELKNIEIKQNFKEMNPLENWIDSFENVIPKSNKLPIAEIKELKALGIKLKPKHKTLCQK